MYLISSSFCLYSVRLDGRPATSPYVVRPRSGYTGKGVLPWAAAVWCCASLSLRRPHCAQPSTSCRCMLMCVREMQRGLAVWNLPRAAASSCWPSPSLLLPQWALPSPSCCTGSCSPKSKELQTCGSVYFLKLWASDLSFWVLLNILISAPPNDLKFSQKFTVFRNCFNVSCIISILGQIWPKNRLEMICF